MQVSDAEFLRSMYAWTGVEVSPPTGTNSEYSHAISYMQDTLYKLKGVYSCADSPLSGCVEALIGTVMIEIARLEREKECGYGKSDG